jgi:hypothetical protein
MVSMSSSISPILLSYAKTGNKEKFDASVKQAQKEGLNFGPLVLSLIRSHSHEYLGRLFSLGVSPTLAIEEGQRLLIFDTPTPLWYARSCTLCEKVVMDAMQPKTIGPERTKESGGKRKSLHTEELPAKRVMISGSEDDDYIPIKMTKSMVAYLKNPADF